jgi:hypothetical protein
MPRVNQPQRRARRSAVVAILVGLLALVVAACGSSAGSSATGDTGLVLQNRPTTAAKLAIVSPEPGAVTGSSFVLRLQLTGATVVAPTQVSGIDPTKGHIHVSVDGKLVSMAYGLSQPVSGLKPGQHTILAQFVASDHRPFANQVLATVVFQVR